MAIKPEERKVTFSQVLQTALKRYLAVESPDHVKRCHGRLPSLLSPRMQRPPNTVFWQLVPIRISILI